MQIINVGKYKVPITSPTYIPEELTVSLQENSDDVMVTLASSIERILCRENQQGFPLEFSNKHYLKKLNNCTYQLTRGNHTATPFKLLVTKNTHESKKLMKAHLGIMKYDPSDNLSTLIIEELKPRVSIVSAGSSGISDVPDAIQIVNGNVKENTGVRLTILEATFSD